MNELFVHVLNVGITGGWIALGVMLLRPLLKKTPRWVFCLLWALVALRLLLPVTLQSAVSLLPSAEVIPADIATTATPAINSGISTVNEAVNPVLTEYVQPESNNLKDLLSLGAIVWLVGVGLLLCYSLVAYLRVACQVRIKVAVQKRIFICDHIDSPFILGVVFPRIYLPSELTTEQQKDVLAHEFAHLKRRDHWWKPLGFLLLSVYWFNPFLWVSYILLCRDIEQACDEKVIASMTPGEKSHYAQTLLQCSARRHMVAACPVAFGEVGVKQRIKMILHYKNPGFWVVLISLIVCGVVAVCFLTNPLPCKHDYQETELSAPSCTETGRSKYVCNKCDHSYVGRTPVMEHHYEDAQVLTEPTCTQKGVLQRICVECGHKVTAEIEMTAHQFEDGQVRIQPTCTNVGVRERVCVECGSTVTAPIEMTAHIPGEYTATRASTCSKEGEATTKCTACGIPMTASIPFNPGKHNMQETVIFRNTCTSLGKSQFTCQWCNHEEIRFFAPYEHQFELVSRTEATCTARGREIYECQKCSYSGTRFLEITDHQYELIYRKESTCTTQGEEHYKCKLCGDMLQNVLYYAPHSYNFEDQCIHCGKKIEYTPWG